ncbi:MAG TPA: deoxynucleoside kinase [bacterium]|nr:deoxynucleoside kinase [bacterium]
MQNQTPHHYIAVDGPIGAGKTTLARMLAEEMGAHLCLEPAEKNPFLAEFYKDRKRNAFKTQLFFLLNRYQQQLELKQQDLFRPSVVADYTFAKDQIFAEINLSEDERALYNTVFNLLRGQLPKPDLVIYLRADSKVLVSRIKKRGYDYERPISADYLENLTDSYNRYFLNYSETPLLVVDTSNQNYLENPDDFAVLKRAIASHKGGTVQLIAR